MKPFLPELIFATLAMIGILTMVFFGSFFGFALTIGAGLFLLLLIRGSQDVGWYEYMNRYNRK